MKLIYRYGSVVLVCIVVAFSAVQSDKPLGCSGASYHQFDFWVGDWEVFDFGKTDTPVAHARVDRILEGCVLLEDYRDNKGSHGQSFSIYDAPRKVWHQTWVTNRGKLLMIEGKLQSGAMVLSGVESSPEGKEQYVRGSWEPVPGGVREVAVTSTDGGKSWTPWFDLLFRPKQM